MLIDRNLIVVDETLYPRRTVLDFRVNRLRDALAIGTKFPPIVIESVTHRLVDGRHRMLAYEAAEIDQVEAVERVYSSEADLFADAVRLNAEHGEPLDYYAIKTAVARLQEFGYSREQIGEVVRLPIARIDSIVKGFAVTESGDALALKGGLGHLANQSLDKRQQAAVSRYGGGQATFYANQLSLLLMNDLWPKSKSFRGAMEKLVALWTEKSIEKDDAA